MSPDLQNFFRLIKLRAYFKDETCIATVNKPNEQLPCKIKNKEKWTPKETHHTVSTYIDLVENYINALMKEPTKKLKSNLTYKEHVAIEELAKKKDLILTNADNGGAVVIMDTDSYIKEANRQLSDKASYKKLTQDPTLQHSRIVNQTIERFKNEKLLPQKIADGLKITNPKTPKFYISPKIHKPNNPGRPVINSFECHTSEFRDPLITISSPW